MTTTLEDALVDVRKAYRLLADYQQRLIELTAFIRSELGATPYFREFRNTTPGEFAGLENSDIAGRRFLPLLDLSILSFRNQGQEAPEHNQRPGDFLLDISLISDSGKSVNKAVNSDAGKSAEESSSGLSIYFFICDEPAPPPFNWFHQVWKFFEYPTYGEVGTSRRVPGYRAYGEFIFLEKLADEQSIRDEIRDLRQRASGKLGIVI